MALEALTSASLNPLVAAAMPLLSAAPRIRHSAQHPNPAGLKEALAEGIRAFEAKARADGLPNEQVIAGTANNLLIALKVDHTMGVAGLPDPREALVNHKVLGQCRKI